MISTAVWYWSPLTRERKVRQQEAENSRNFLSLALLRRNSSIGVGSAAFSHSFSSILCSRRLLSWAAKPSLFWASRPPAALRRRFYCATTSHPLPIQAERFTAVPGDCR